MSRMVTSTVVECDQCGQYVGWYSCGKVQTGNTITLCCGHCGKESQVRE